MYACTFHFDKVAVVQSFCLRVCLSICLPAYLPTYLYLCTCPCMCMCMYIHRCTYMPVLTSAFTYAQHASMPIHVCQCTAAASVTQDGSNMPPSVCMFTFHYIYMCVHRCMYTHRSSQGHMHRCTPVPAYIPSRSHILCFTLLGVYAYWDFVSCNGSVFRPCSCQLLLQFSRLVTTCYRDHYCHAFVVTPLNLLWLLLLSLLTPGRSTSSACFDACDFTHCHRIC